MNVARVTSPRFYDQPPSKICNLSPMHHSGTQLLVKTYCLGREDQTGQLLWKSKRQNTTEVLILCSQEAGKRATHLCIQYLLDDPCK
mmetsp:Transcript_11992/g.20875  ORF Transcript_11992/g.20875 Transcript_11992/m.20875 type:complete len:87 (+) Transcript_11992:258-518(+)